MDRMIGPSLFHESSDDEMAAWVPQSEYVGKTIIQMEEEIYHLNKIIADLLNINARYRNENYLESDGRVWYLKNNINRLRSELHRYEEVEMANDRPTEEHDRLVEDLKFAIGIYEDYIYWEKPNFEKEIFRAAWQLRRAVRWCTYLMEWA